MKETDRLLQDIKNELTFMQTSFLEKSSIEDLLKQILEELREIKSELGKNNRSQLYEYFHLVRRPYSSFRLDRSLDRYAILSI